MGWSLWLSLIGVAAVLPCTRACRRSRRQDMMLIQDIFLLMLGLIDRRVRVLTRAMMLLEEETWSE
jgi:hypothetical protein